MHGDVRLLPPMLRHRRADAAADRLAD
jgi:hypothetical protein